MKTIKGLILCEGETDQVLISSYLGQLEGWSYFKCKDAPFADKNASWYKRSDSTVLGIWWVGGHSFGDAIREVFAREKLEASIEKIVVVTDHDDVEAESSRSEEVFSTICNEVGISFCRDNYAVGNWCTVSFDGSFGRASVDIAYLLVPENKVGALETFMLDALAEGDRAMQEAIVQARQFIADFKSDEYLKRRRDKTKAELGVSLAVFSPDRVFTTMKEIIDMVDWASFDLTNTQFALLREI